MRNQSFKAVVLAVLSLAMVAGVQAAPSDYTFTNIVNLTAAGLQVTSPPIINNQGQVAFQAADNANTSSFVIRAQGNQQTIIAQGADAPILGSMNDHGVVTLLRPGTDVPVQGVYTSDGVTTTTITERIHGQSGYDFSFPVGLPQINNDGTVVFSSVKNGQESGLFAAKNGQITKIFTSPLGQPGPQRINDNGEVVFQGQRTSDGAAGLFAVNVNGGAVTPIVLNKDLGANVSISGQFSVNNKGRVAFMLQRPDSNAIATSDGGPIAIVASSLPGEAVSVLGGSSPSINDNGEVAFLGGYRRNGQIISGIFTGPDPNVNSVIQTGDPLFGSTFLGITIFDTNALNDKGQIAFYYSLTNGVNGIAVATPIPDPTAVSTIGILFITMALRRQR
jgi:hypothetical protein